MATNEDVARAFAAGRAEAAGHFRCTPREVYSYRMKIAQRRPDGVVELLEHQRSPSQTTSRHMSEVQIASACVRVSQFTDPTPAPPSPERRRESESLDTDPAIWSV
jgi:hypothetical protein